LSAAKTMEIGYQMAGLKVMAASYRLR
jgi:hypothetical protein